LKTFTFSSFNDVKVNKISKRVDQNLKTYKLLFSFLLKASTAAVETGGKERKNRKDEFKENRLTANFCSCTKYKLRSVTTTKNQPNP